MDNISNKKILPFSYLVLYAKGWIRHPWIKDRTTDEEYLKEIKIILKMCGYMPVTHDDILNLVLISVDTLKDEFIKEKQNFNYELMNYRNFINGVKNYESLYNIKSFDVAMIKFIMSCFSMLDIRHWAIMNVDYSLYKLKYHNTQVSTTYKHCQKKFNETFKDMLIPQSFETQWHMKYIKD